MTITTILFDVGGVIVAPLDLKAALERRENLAQRLGFGSGEEMWLYFYESAAWEAAKTGRMRHEEMWETLLMPHGFSTLEDRARFVNDLHHGEGVLPSMIGLLTALKKRYKLGILSNWDDRLEEILEEKLGIDHYFDVILNSHRIGAAKPSEEAFRIALERLEAQPGEVFFIDDLDRNTRAAAALGMQTHAYRDLPGLIADLKEQGLLDGEVDHIL